MSNEELLYDMICVKNRAEYIIKTTKLVATQQEAIFTLQDVKSMIARLQEAGVKCPTTH